MSEYQSLFLPDGDLFVPTEAAGNPWGELTGGGPVAGLLARAIEQAIDDPDRLVARLTVDLMRPVPRRGLEVSHRVLRSGKRLQVIEACLTLDGTEVAHAVAQAVHRSETGETAPVQPPPFAGPDGVPDGSLVPAGLGLRWGVHDVVEVRWIADQSSRGPSRAWMRMPLPLLPDEPPSPLVHTAVLVDCISAASPVGSRVGPWINTDITLYLHRELDGEWLGMEMERDTESTGVGTARARLFDRHGPIGVADEAVLVNQLG
ncbi:acyl-CoA thioesterase [Halopolyspora algeriensis]|uniref:Acyl-CoA thioesterase n=1 Tax=Halopolyspora algeriensis TaxID=1500506 RepID=A0A368VDH4_9ACTN|nr:thioesterase family protein [Halopolyspora algeriensis]RCW39188.1 acyl-CoA thioesterase [Halopolyspora algeriensis]TQM47444.1 acyl-CoA thioesterase [Halopolyspora algeriensis]